MTEAEWLGCNDPTTMLGFLHGKASERKLRLFAVGCCRSIWHLLTEKLWRQGVEMAEKYADGTGSKKKMGSLWQQIERMEIARWSKMPYASWQPSHAVEGALKFSAFSSAERVSVVYSTLARSTVNQIAILRDIFGNPFRPVSLDESWLTSDVLALARGIYEERAFDRMPILADAIQDAGCTNEDVLSHCRDANQVHVRGCWVVDLVLGRE